MPFSFDMSDQKICIEKSFSYFNNIQKTKSDFELSIKFACDRKIKKS